MRRPCYRLARLLEEQADRFALAETLNMGKTLKESKGDIGYVVRTLEYFAGLADKIEGETIPVPGPRLDYTRPRAARGHGPHRPVELPSPPRDPVGRPGARRRERGRPQAGAASPP